MQIPLQLTFRHMDHSAALEANIRDHVAVLEQFCPDLIRAEVVIERQHQRHRQGNLFHLRIHLTLPGAQISVNRSPDEHHAHEDVYVAVRDAFDDARRQLEDAERRRRGKVKRHEPAAEGTIGELVPMEDYGRIVTPEGREVYFHRHSVVNADFDRLEEGQRVRFTEEAGAEGPQASTVHLL